ncbi:hypothetical protein ACJZL1_03125 [Wolbachia endosymbiont of Rhagoletis indifferens]
MLAPRRYDVGLLSSRCLLAAEIPWRHDVEAILLYSPNQFACS